MLRSILIYLSTAKWMRRVVVSWKLARNVALRFVAGEKLEEAIQICKELNHKGMNVTLDQLGEDTNTPDEARQTAQEIMGVLDAVKAAGVRSNISMKLNQIGLRLDEELCAENLEKILVHAKKYNIFVRIDMEDSPYTSATIELYYRMKQKGYDNVGMVIQSYLYRSEDDTKKLLGDGTRIRMVKGAYKESPEVAFPKKHQVDHAFDVLTRLMLDASHASSAPAVSADGIWPPIPAVASHDEVRILNAKNYAEKIGLPKDKLEFQMLFGIRRELQEQLVAEGYPVRIYVPFGTQWYPYFMRRLAERPANLWFFISSLVRR